MGITAIKSNRDLKPIILSSIAVRSVTSKAQLFHSSQMIHIRHKGMAFQQLPPEFAKATHPTSQQVHHTARHNPLHTK